MKKLYFAFALIAALFCLPATAVFAQGSDHESKDTGVSLDKYVTGPDADGQYLITLEAYAKGSSITTVTEEVQPTDIVIVMDYSSSMTSNSVDVIKSRTRVSTGTTLSTATNYLVKKDGNEYYLKGFQNSSYKYTQRDSQNYTYKSYGDNTFYYKSGNNYYEVKSSSQGSYPKFYRLSYTVGRQTYYLSGTGVTTTPPQDVTSQTTTIWAGVLYERSQENTYRYRYGSTLPARDTDGNEFYSGTSNYTVKATDEIYTYTTESKTRLALAKEAAIQFVETVYKNSPAAPEGGGTQQYHKLAVVRFNTAAGTLVNLQNVTSTSYKTIQNSINNYNNVENGTRPWLGLNQAGTILESVKTDGRKKIVVFFTDGVPGDSPSKLSADYARQSVNSSYTLKNTYGATVFSVAVLSSSDMSKMDMRRYLQYVSSNYKFNITGNTYDFTSDHSSATCQIEGHTTWHGSEDPHDYYQLSDGSDLTAIFDKIAEEASSGGASIKLSAETTTVLDVLTADYVLPEGADINSIGLYVDEVTGYNSTAETYSFGNRTDLVPSDGSRSDYVSFKDAVVDGKTTKKIIVTGFDFTKEDTPANGEILYGNWVGPRETTEGGTTTTVYKGRRLVITIPIMTAPDYQGGYSLPTNSGESGIYVKDSETPLDVFPVPGIDFPSIGIIKNGLRTGESSIFKVQRIKDSKGESVEDAVYTILLTGCSPEGSSPAYTIINNIPEGTYRVEETSWSWSYNVSGITVMDGNNQTTLIPQTNEAPSVTQVLAKSRVSAWPDGILETAKCVLLTFTNIKKTSDIPDHAESVVRNDFRTPGEGVTVNSKPQPGASGDQ